MESRSINYEYGKHKSAVAPVASLHPDKDDSMSQILYEPLVYYLALDDINLIIYI